jgi:hypothetical protein
MSVEFVCATPAHASSSRGHALWFRRHSGFRQTLNARVVSSNSSSTVKRRGISRCRTQ